VAKQAVGRASPEKIVDRYDHPEAASARSKLREEVWQTADGKVTKYNLAYINHMVCRADNGRVLGYDNSHDGHHRHFTARWSRLPLPATLRLRNGFRTKSTNYGWWKNGSTGGDRMNKTVKTATRIGTGTADAFLSRSRARAQHLDRGERLLPEMRLTFEDPADLLRLLTAQRVRVLNAVRRNPAPVSELAIVLGRDRTAVRRDVRILTAFGLVNTREETNPGHGRRKIVGPLASKCELVTTI
jgi:predicted transcriptional regulator